MDIRKLVDHVSLTYGIKLRKAEPLRKGGSATYVLYGAEAKYLLKCISAAFADSVAASAKVQLYLIERGFGVPPLVLTKSGSCLTEYEGYTLVLYEYLELYEIDMARDAEAVGALIGELHALMAGYNGALAVHDKAFYVDRYLDILTRKHYPKKGRVL